MKRLLWPLALAATLIAALPAWSETQHMPIYAQVSNSCAVHVNPLNFGTLKSTDFRTAETSIIVDTMSTSYIIRLGWGANNNRTMDAAGNVRYQLFKDPSRTQIWGNGTVGGYTGITGSGSNSYPVYGQVRTTGAAEGNYSDTVLVEVTL